MTSFNEALGRFILASCETASKQVSQNKEACRAVAIGILSKMTKKQINTEAKSALVEKIGQDAADTAWKSAKVPLSQAWRAIAGEYGFGEALAQKWAAGDFEVSLAAAYEASAGPRKDVDNVARAVKLLVNMTADDRENVATQVADILSKQDEAEQRRNSNAVKFGLIKPEVAETQDVAA